MIRAPRAPESLSPGLLIVNADDWGRDPATTDRTLECVAAGTVSAVSAMVFMEDSARAAALATERGLDAALHLNLTTVFSAPECPGPLRDVQQRLGRYLRRTRLSQIVFHPGLAKAFRHVVAAQLDEFRRLYGRSPDRIDGHHHMHLSANVLLGRLLPAGALVRRSFSFRAGEKSLANVVYRRAVDRLLARRHPLADFFFSLPPLQPDRLQRIFALARDHAVEVETHPINPAEYRFLTEGTLLRETRGLRIAPARTLLGRRPTSQQEAS